MKKLFTFLISLSLLPGIGCMENTQKQVPAKELKIIKFDPRNYSLKQQGCNCSDCRPQHVLPPK